jgi:hypothetical protein
MRVAAALRSRAVTSTRQVATSSDEIRFNTSHHIKWTTYLALLGRSSKLLGRREKAAAEENFRALKVEVAKGKHADDSVVAKLVEGLVGLVPGAVAGIVSAFASPVLSGLAGPVTKYALDKIQRK